MMKHTRCIALAVEAAKPPMSACVKNELKRRGVIEDRKARERVGGREGVVVPVVV